MVRVKLSMLTVIIFVTGLTLGILLTYALLRERASTWFERWKSEYEDEIRRDVAERSRATLKGRIGEQIAPFLPMFNYEPSDARFIGSPVDYVIFEGHSKEDPQRITFADIKTGKTAKLTPKQRRFKEIIEEGNVRWETIHLEGLEEG